MKNQTLHLNRSMKMHFDVSLMPDQMKNDQLTGPVIHPIRQKIFNPLPAKGNHPIFEDSPEITVRQGFSVTRMNAYAPSTSGFSFKSTNSPLMFDYVLSGKRLLSVKKSSSETVTDSGHWYAGYVPECSGSGVSIGSPVLKGVKFRFDPLVLYNLLEGKVDGFPGRLSLLLKKLESGVIILSGKMNTAMKVAAEQIIHSPYEKAAQSIQFESQVLDLLILHLKEMHDSNLDSEHNAGYNVETKLAKNAREILIDSIDKPPTLSHIASSLGVSIVTLKSSFVKVFGVSLHQYIQNRRMETARKLLEYGEMNVNEVATKIGYSNVSRFIAAFNRYFGVKPGVFMRQARKLYSVADRIQSSNCEKNS